LMSFRLICFFILHFDTTIITFSISIIGTFVSEYTRNLLYKVKKRKETELDSIPELCIQRTVQSVETINDIGIESGESESNIHEDVCLLNFALLTAMMALVTHVITMHRIGCFF
jgi:hypothetical protein